MRRTTKYRNTDSDQCTGGTSLTSVATSSRALLVARRSASPKARGFYRVSRIATFRVCPTHGVQPRPVQVRAEKARGRPHQSPDDGPTRRRLQRSGRLLKAVIEPFGRENGQKARRRLVGEGAKAGMMDVAQIRSVMHLSGSVLAPHAASCEPVQYPRVRTTMHRPAADRQHHALDSLTASSGPEDRSPFAG